MEGCGVEGNALPELVELFLIRPLPARTPRLVDDGCGEVNRGGALTAHTFTDPSAQPETRKMRSGDPWEFASPNMEPKVVGSTHRAQTASVCPLMVVLGSTLPLSQTLMVASFPPENIHPSPWARPPVEKFGEEDQEARDRTGPSCPRWVKSAVTSRSVAALKWPL